MIQNELWKKCVEFHGHECGGLAIGYNVAMYAMKLLNLKRSDDEEVVCISECDACSVDAIQVVLGCSVGKGNLLFHLTGKFAFSFYERKSNRSVRLVLDVHDDGMTHEESRELYMNCSMEKMFAVKETKIAIPEHARILDCFVCEACGETVAENYVHIQNGKKLCVDCYTPYRRFDL